MKPFNNLERWQQLKSLIIDSPDLYDIIRVAWQELAGYERMPKNSELIQFVEQGRSRRIYRVKHTVEHPVVIDKQQIVLALKVPYALDATHLGEYANVDDIDRKFPEDKLRTLDLEVRAFEVYAKQGRNVPKVTGIIAGYGLIGTLTEDLTEGGKCKISFNNSGAQEISKQHRTGRLTKTFADCKYLGPHNKSKTNYLKERLQIDGKS